MEIETIIIVVLSLLFLSLGCFYIAHVGKLKQENKELKKKLQGRDEYYKGLLEDVEKHLKPIKDNITSIENKVIKPTLYPNYRI